MVLFLNSFFYNTTLFLAYLLVAKYVFFEKGLKGKTNINFHAVALIGILVSSIFIKALSKLFLISSLEKFVPKRSLIAL